MAPMPAKREKAASRPMSSAKTIVGLDFGTYSIKAVWLEKTAAGVSVARTEELQVPPETKDPVEFIRPWLEKHGLHKTLCAVAIPGTQTVFQPVFLPAGDPRSDEEAAGTEVASFTEMAGEAMRYGAAPFPAPDGGRGLQIALVRPGVVESGLRGAAAFSLRLCELVPSPVAAFNGLVGDAAASGGAPNLAPTRPTLYLSVGHQTTDLAIGAGSGLLFARSFAVGGKAFTDAIARARNVSELQAERLKKTEGGLDDGSPLAEILRPVATMWASQVKSALAVFRGQFQRAENQPARVAFAGGGAKLAGFEAFAAETLALEVAQPFPPPAVPPVFATAYGLALAGAEAAPCPITLFPVDLRNELVFREKKPYWIAAGVFASLILGTFLVTAVRGLARERAAVERETARIRSLQRIDQTIQRLRAEGASYRECALPIRRLLEAGPQARELVRLLADSIHPNDWVTMVSDETLYNAEEMPDIEEEAGKARAKSGAASKGGLGRGRSPLLRVAAPPRPATPPGASRPSPQGGGQNGSASRPPTVSTPKPPSAKGGALERRGGGVPLPPPPPTFSVFIVEGYTPQTDLSTVRELVGKLLASPTVRRADVLWDDRVLPAMPLGDRRPPESLVGRLSRFVLRVEVNPQ